MKTTLFLIALVTGGYYAMSNNQQYPTIVDEQLPDELIVTSSNIMQTFKQEVEIEKINSEISVYNLKQKELSKLKYEIDQRINLFFTLVDSLRVFSNSLSAIDSTLNKKNHSFNYKLLAISKEDKMKEDLFLQQNLETELLFQKRERNTAYQIMLADNSIALFYHQFELNKFKITELFFTFNQNTAVKSNMETLNEEINLLFISIKQLQEEAHAQTHPAAILGGLNNAQEKTTTALSKQQKIIELLLINQKIVPEKDMKGNFVCLGSY